MQVTAAPDGAGDEVTYIVPPSRAVWIAPGALHSVHVLETPQFRTLYIDATVTPPGWSGCRVLVVSPLLRELVDALDAPGSLRAREALLTGLVLDELAPPTPRRWACRCRARSRRQAPARAVRSGAARAGERATLAEWAADVGASERTMARLFRDELGTSYQQWRQQAVLAHALPLLARGMPVSQVAAASGYASDSAFTAMFKAAMGQPPSHFQARRPCSAPAAHAIWHRRRGTRGAAGPSGGLSWARKDEWRWTLAGR